MFDGDWPKEASRDICDALIACQKARHHSAVKISALSLMTALEHERKYLSSIPQEQRILSSTEKKDYHDHVIKAFLQAVSELDPDEVLQSFSHTGTGGLHRAQATFLATVSNVIGAASQFAPDMTAKLVLSAIRAAMSVVTSAEIMNSAGRRVRLATLEELGPLGRADAPPSAKDKNAPNMFQASTAVLVHLHDAKKIQTKIQIARQELNRANCALEAMPIDPVRQCAVRDAERKLQLTFAKLCYQL
jgi:hypothetical protein